MRLRPRSAEKPSPQHVASVRGGRGLSSFVSTGCNLFWSQPVPGGVEKKRKKEIGFVVWKLDRASGPGVSIVQLHRVDNSRAAVEDCHI